jgi:two-component system OmpR family response regulator
VANTDSCTPGATVGRSLRVLLVEDSDVLAQRLNEAIRHLRGINLIGVTDTEAVAIAVAKKEGVDVIVLDLHLKQGTGFGIMRALAALQRKPVIIVLTNFDLPKYKQTSLAFGARHFLDKARDFGRLPELLIGLRKECLALQYEA